MVLPGGNLLLIFWLAIRPQLQGCKKLLLWLHDFGLNVLCVICDQGATNQQMFRLFGINKENPCVVIADLVVFFMFDPPHLLKSIRNNLMKHNFEVSGNLIKWKYINDFF